MCRSSMGFFEFECKCVKKSLIKSQKCSKLVIFFNNWIEQNWITRLICYGTSTPRVLGLESCYCESYTNLKEYF